MMCDMFGSLHPQLNDQQRRRKRGFLDHPVKSVNLKSDTTIAELVDMMSDMSIQARNIGQCAKVMHQVYTDPDRPTVILGLAGPLIAAGLRQVIRDLIITKAVDVIVSTGAIIYQDIYQARGGSHFKGTPKADDQVLRELHLDRIYDTYVDEDKFDEIDEWCGRVADELEPGLYSSRMYIKELGKRLDDEHSIVAQACTYGVPIFCPALNDSSIGIGLTEHRVRCMNDVRTGVIIDSIRDNVELTQIIVNSPCTAAFYVAGGVPKNFINDSVVMGYIYKVAKAHRYAIQVSTAVEADGGLSSSTLKEAVSWGKIDGNARTAMAWVEPSIGLPLIAGHIFAEGLSVQRSRLNIKYDNSHISSISHIKHTGSDVRTTNQTLF